MRPLPVRRGGILPNSQTGSSRVGSLVDKKLSGSIRSAAAAAIVSEPLDHETAGGVQYQGVPDRLFLKRSLGGK